MFLSSSSSSSSNAAAHLDPDGARLALRAQADDVAIVGMSERLELLTSPHSKDAKDRYVEAYGVCGTRRFQAKGATIYQLSVETFPRHVNNVYVVVEDDASLLFDCGSGLSSSERDLALGFHVIGSVFGDSRVASRDQIQTCLVSHAHADHWGGVNVLKKASPHIKLEVHELDAQVIESFEERLLDASSKIEAYWEASGVEAEQRALMKMLYESGKRLFHSEKVDRLLRDGDLVFRNGAKIHHVPGHCPGLLCLQVHDVLLTSDHVLARITPHQFPQEIAQYGGLDHYFKSLEKIRSNVAPAIRLALGGHEEPITDTAQRIDEIEAFHRARLQRVVEICEATPSSSINDVAREMFGNQEGYGVILAIDEAGAHIEYLVQQGRLRVTEDNSGIRHYDVR